MEALEPPTPPKPRRSFLEIFSSIALTIARIGEFAGFVAGWLANNYPKKDPPP